MSNRYRIHGGNGADLGTYEAEDEYAACDALARKHGYDSWRSAYKREPERYGELCATLVPAAAQ